MYLKSEALKLSNKAKTTHDHPGVIWLQGEDSCKLAVVAVALEHVLSRQGYAVTLLDYDQINTGLCRGLTNNTNDRVEYARRVAETAKLFAENDMLTIVMVDSLSADEDILVRDILQDFSFSSAYLEFLPQGEADRDVLEDGQCLIGNATRPFITLLNPELHIEADGMRNEAIINLLLEHLEKRRSLKHGFSALASTRKSKATPTANEVPISIAAG